MPLQINVTIRGRVGAAVVRVEVDGVEAAIAADRTFAATIAATPRLVGITTIDGNGRMAHRSVRIGAAPVAAG